MYWAHVPRVPEWMIVCGHSEPVKVVTELVGDLC